VPSCLDRGNVYTRIPTLINATCISFLMIIAFLRQEVVQTYRLALIQGQDTPEDGRRRTQGIAPLESRRTTWLMQSQTDCECPTNEGALRPVLIDRGVRESRQAVAAVVGKRACSFSVACFIYVDE
jgi:hypothetical protein